MNKNGGAVPPKTVGIVGGGPGGLMTAFLLEKRSKLPCDITIFEAGPRLGGKILTQQFSAAPVKYEAGAAELYDYSQLGPDPLRGLVSELGLSVTPLDGQAIVMDNCVLKSTADIRTVFGEGAHRALEAFNALARRSISPAEYYESDWKEDNEDPLSRMKFRDLLARVKDENVRRYIEVAVHSDLATEPHLTNATYGLQNYLMNEPDYMRLYSIDGGNERLPLRLAERLRSRVLLNNRVTRVERAPEDRYRVFSRSRGETQSHDFDYLVIALPNNWIPSITWGGAVLAEAMHQHHAFYDYPAHYLRVSILFSKPFWRSQISGSYFMVDEFGGCCVYDESSRDAANGYGVLGWLIAGESALSMNNCDDLELMERVLDSLPSSMRHGRQYFLEGKVHRWTGTVNGLPGGYPAREPDSRHLPEPSQHPELFVVGDYLFDSTINGVLDSADVVAEWICEDLEETVAGTVRAATAAAEPAAATEAQSTKSTLRVAVS